MSQGLLGCWAQVEHDEKRRAISIDIFWRVVVVVFVENPIVNFFLYHCVHVQAHSHHNEVPGNLFRSNPSRAQQ